MNPYIQGLQQLNDFLLDHGANMIQFPADDRRDFVIAMLSMTQEGEKNVSNASGNAKESL